MWQPCNIDGFVWEIMNKAQDLSALLAVLEYNFPSYGLVVCVLNDINHFCGFGFNSLNKILMGH